MEKTEKSEMQKALEAAEEYFSLPVWAFCHDVERIVRKFSTKDFIRYPDL